MRAKHDVWVETAYLPSHHRCIAEGVAATTITRTVVDLSSRLPAGEAVALIDSALRQGVVVAELAEVCDELGIDASSSIADLIGFGDRRSQSVLESMSRWQLHTSKLPAPELQALLGDDSGPFAAVDFYWKEAGVVGEADGLLKYHEDPAALRAEKLRQERLERMGLIVVRWTWADMVSNPSGTVARVRDALRQGAARRTSRALPPAI